MVSMMMIISVPLYKHTQVVWPVQDEITEKKEKNKPADLRINVFCLLFFDDDDDENLSSIYQVTRSVGG